MSKEQRGQFFAPQSFKKRRVPSELDPLMFTESVGMTDEDEDDDALDIAYRAFSGLSRTLDEIYKREVVIRADGTKTPAHHAVRVNEMVMANMSTPAQRIDTARQALMEQIDETEKSITKKYRCHQPFEYAKEMRQSIAAKTDAQRQKLLFGKDASRDHVAAVLAADPISSNLSGPDAHRLKEVTRKAWFPAETRRIEKLQKALKVLEKASDRYLATVSQLTDKRADNLSAQERAADEAVSKPITIDAGGQE